MLGSSSSSDLPLRDQLLHVVDSAINPIEVAITIAQILDSSVNADQVRREIQKLTEMVPEPQVDCLVSMLRQEGFSGERLNLDPVDNSRIDQALKYKTANPITLAMVLIGVARYLDIECHGVNFPQHFLASVNGELVDPLQMEVVAVSDLRSWAKSHGIPDNNLFARASNVDIAIRMLNNVFAALDIRTGLLEALTVLDYKALLVPNPTEILMERARVWLEVGEVGMAKELLEEALASASHEHIKERIRRRILSLSAGNETVN